MKKTISIILVSIVILVTVIVSIISLVPTNKYKTTIEKNIYNLTGLHLLIKGDIKIGLIPRLQVKLLDTYLSGDSNKDNAILAVSALQFNLELVPLLSGKIVLNDCTIQDPHLSLDKLNHFIAHNRKANIPVSSSTPNKQFNLQLGKIIVKNGTILSHKEGRDISFAEINSELDIPNEHNIAGDFSFTKDAKKFSINLSAHSNSSESPKQLNMIVKVNNNEKIHIGGELKPTNSNFTGKLEANNIDLNLIKLLQGSFAPFQETIALIDANKTERKQATPFTSKLEVEVKNLHIQDIKIDKISGALKTTPNNIHFEFAELLLNHATGHGRVDIIKNNYKLNLSLINLNIAPLLQSQNIQVPINGIADIDLNLRTAGIQTEQIKSSLSGAASLYLHHGEITKINAQAATLLSTILGVDIGKIPLKSVKGNFTLHNGLVTNDDLLVESSLFQLKGKGSVHLPSNTINFRVTPTAAVGKFTNKSGTSLMIEGNLNKPHYNLDASEVIAKQIGKFLEKKGLPGIKSLKSIPNIKGFEELQKLF